MGSINKLKLVNFQSHRNTEIEFDKGLTVILGQTDQGKSAIIRALKWVLYNEPRGTDFITAGCNSCSVTLEMNDGTIITRARDKNKNRYILQKGDKKEVFEGFGNTVPLEIVKAHGIPKIQIDKDIKSAVNLAEQLEPPFLISETAGNRAKALGRLVGVHIIDAAQRSTNRDLTNTEQHFKFIKKEIGKIKEELKDYDNISQLKIKIDNLKKILTQLKQYHIKYLKLKEIDEKLEVINRNLLNSKNILTKFKTLNLLEQCVLKAEKYFLEFTQLSRINTRMCQNNYFIKNEKKTLKNTKHIYDIEKEHISIVDLYRNFVKVKNISSKLSSNKKDMLAWKKQINKTKNITITEENIIKLNNLKEKLKNLTLINVKIVYIDKQIMSQEKTLQTLRKLIKADKQIHDISIMLARLTTLASLKNSISMVNEAISKGESYIASLSKNLTIMVKKYSLTLNKLSKCPTCMNPIDSQTTKKIASELLQS